MIKPEVAFRSGLRMGSKRRLDYDQLTTQQIEHVMTVGIRGIVADLLRPDQVSGAVESRGRGRWREHRTSSAPQARNCLDCGAVIPIVLGSTRRYCKACVSHHATPRKLPDYVCEWCGKTYRPKSSRQRFCSAHCSGSRNGGIRRSAS